MTKRKTRGKNKPSRSTMTLFGGFGLFLGHHFTIIETQQPFIIITNMKKVERFVVPLLRLLILGAAAIL